MRTDLALAALASAAVPGMKPVAVASLTPPGNEPHDHQQAVVEDATGRRWLVRSPLTPVAGARLQRNDELVRQLSRHVPFKVPAPVGYASVGQDGHAVVYPHVEGMPLDLTRLPAGQGLAHAVGRTVAAIHNISRGVFEEQDVPVFDAAGCRQRLIAEVDRASETGRVPTGLLARWEEAFDAAPLWQFATTPVHGGFQGSSVLVAFADDDSASGRVVAVTDWEEAMVGDPAVDLAELYSAASPAAWESVLDAYALARAQRPDPYLHARARLVAETRRLRGLARSVSDGDEELTRRAVEALRRMDRLTEDEDSLVPVTARGGRGALPVPPVTAGVGEAPAAGRAVEMDDAVADDALVDDDALLHDEAVPDDAVADAAVEGDAPDVEAEGFPQIDPDMTAEVPFVAEPAVPVDDPDLDADPDVADLDVADVDLVEDTGHDADAVTENDPTDDRAPEDGSSTGDVVIADSPDDEDDSDDQHDSGEGTDDELEQLDDEERLHELYGMPDPDRDQV